MFVETIERDFREKVCSELRLVSEGLGRFRVFTPFLFDDGDHLSIVLKHEGGKWFLSDEGHTYMHLTYDLDAEALQSGTRQEIIANALSAFGVQDWDGELKLVIEDGQYGDALYSFVQALLKISDVTYLSRERVKSTFYRDFQTFFTEVVPEERRQFNWYHPQRDPQRMYTVDCVINSMPKPLFVYALPSDDRTRDATIALLQFEKWKLVFRSLAVFEDQETIGRKVLARFTNVCERQFSSFGGDTPDRIKRYVEEAMQVL
jgi:hypothetical protein